MNNQSYSNQPTLSCQNCGAQPLPEQKFCNNCGQKSDTHIISFREMLAELADGLFNMDSRVWRSLIPLAIHPGRLTNEYLAGKRMHYLPPFRLYLILSVLFFLFPENQPNFDTNEAPRELLRDEISATRPFLDERRPLDASTVEPPSVDELIDDPIVDAPVLEPDSLENGLSCELGSLPPNSLLKSVYRDVCLKFAEEPEEMATAFAESLSVMMIVGLPLVALIMQTLYFFSNRRYVEHLIFQLHTHAFVFLIGIAISVSSIISSQFPFLNTPLSWINFFAFVYIPVYIFLALQRVYKQSKKITLLKAFILSIGYIFSIVIVMAFAALVAALLI